MDSKRMEIEIRLLHERICYALADPTRILILYCLFESPRFVNEIVDTLGQPQSTVSRHLAVLRERKLVVSTRDGAAVKYELADVRIIESLNILRSILTTQLSDSIEIAQAVMD